MSEQTDSRGLVPVDPHAVTQSLLRAIQLAADKATVATDTREMDECAKAALNFSQAVVLLDPTLSPDGVPLDHQLAMERVKGQNALDQTKAKAAASTPAKKTVRVGRDQQGRPSSYELTGGG